MVKKPTVHAKSEVEASAPQQASDKPAASPRDAIVDALMRLAAQRSFDDISISAIAAEAGVSLAKFRDLFPSKGAILGAYARRIDLVVLEGVDPELDAEGTRDRLFDVLMRRIDAMAPDKEALREIARALRRDPLSLAAMNQVALNSMRFMLEAAGVATEGPLGALKLQGGVLAFARTMDTWFDDDDPGLARTLARLDRELGRGERLLGWADDAWRLTAPLRAVGRALVSGGRQLRGRGAGRAEDAPADDVDGDGYPDGPFDDSKPARAV